MQISKFKTIKPSKKELLYFEIQKKKGNNLIEMADKITEYAYFNSFDSFKLIYVNKNIEKYFGLKFNEILEKDVDFLKDHFCLKLLNKSVSDIQKFAQKDNGQKIICHFQKIRTNKNSDFNTFICFTSACRDLNCFFTCNIPVESFSNVAKNVNYLINTNNFYNKNYNRFSSLTQRETEVMKLIGQGYSRKEIAELLHISKYTLDNHRKHIREKLKINSTAEMFRYIHTFCTFS